MNAKLGSFFTINSRKMRLIGAKILKKLETLLGFRMFDQALSKENTFKIHLHGLFRMVDKNGKDCTPRGIKTCALLAVLACSSSLKCSRAFLQDKLWSDRGKEHGAASLRQCLSEIRRTFGRDCNVLLSDRRTVGLDPQLIDVIADPQDGEFLEGLDVRDAEFEDWLTLERSKRTPDTGVACPQLGTGKVDVTARPSLQVHVFRSDASDPALTGVEDLMLDCLGRTLREMLLADVVSFPRHTEVRSDPNCDIRVKLRAFTLGGRMIGLRVSAEDGRSGSLIWSDTQQTFLKGVLPKDSVELLRIGNEMLDALSYHFALKAQQNPDRAGSGMLVHLALQHLFSMTEEGSKQADQLLSFAGERDARNGLVHATRAHVRAIQWAEQYGLEEGQLRYDARRFFDSALAAEPTNAAVLATLANTTLILEKNLDLSTELSDRAIQLNPSNPFAWWVKSASELYLKKYEAAHQSALRASDLLGPGPLKFWWDQQKGLTTAIAGSMDEAIADLRRTHASAPSFRPTLRVLVALYAVAGNHEGVAEISAKLRELEHEFSPERLVLDTEYPAALLRSERFMTDQSRAILLET